LLSYCSEAQQKANVVVATVLGSILVHISSDTMNLRASDEAVLNEFFKNTKYPSPKKRKRYLHRYKRNLHPRGTSVRREDDERV
jgi:hypothetical protein